jgi:hypothetical protein
MPSRDARFARERPSRMTQSPCLKYSQHLLHIVSQGGLFLVKVSARTQDTDQTRLSAHARAESSSSSRSNYLTAPSLGLRHDPPHAASHFLGLSLGYSHALLFAAMSNALSNCIDGPIANLGTCTDSFACCSVQRLCRTASTTDVLLIIPLRRDEFCQQLLDQIL